jgi:hypothetical protein
MKIRLDILLFSALIFSLTALGLAFLIYDWLELTFWSVSPFWLTCAYIVIWALALGFAFEFFVEKGRMSGERFFLLTSTAVLVSALVMHSSWIIVTPRWSLSISTDKSTYNLGETVEITVCLTNNGFITHSFNSRWDSPAIVVIRHYSGEGTVWWSAANLEDTYFSVGPKQVLQRIFFWNQTGHAVYVEIIPGEYSIYAETSAPLQRHVWALHINITSA